MGLNFDTESVTPALVCVECGHGMDRTSGPCAPGPGACALCFFCGSLNVFDADMRFRRPTDAEVFAVARDEDFQRARRAILEVQNYGTPKA